MDNMLFTTNPNEQTSATFGWQTPDQALWGVKEGFKAGADELVKIALREGRRNNNRVLDTYIFPIMFLYRHSLEVSIKIIYHRCFGKIPSGKHNLCVLWDQIYEDVLIKYLQNDVFIQMVKERKSRFIHFPLGGIDFLKLRKVFIDFQQIDGKSDTFRYMVDLDGKTRFNKSIFIDYEKIKNLMTETFQILDFIYEVCDEYMSS